MVEKRIGEFLPAFRYDKKVDRYVQTPLPDYTTIEWLGNEGELFNAQVHPDRVDFFKENQEKIEGRRIEWL